jgi:hypothetical protein
MAAPIRQSVAKPAAAKPQARTITPSPAVAAKAPPPTVAPPQVAASPPPVAVQPPPVMPSPGFVADSDPALVTVHPLTARKVSEDDGSFSGAVAATASQTQGLPRLRPIVGIIALAAALLALIRIWWQSFGARIWGVRRRQAQPRLMIDVPLSEEPGIRELAMGEIALGRAEGWNTPDSSRLGDRAAAE